MDHCEITEVTGLPGVIIEPTERNTHLPMERDYEVSVGGAQGMEDIDADRHYVLLSMQRARLAFAEVYLSPRQAREVARWLLRSAEVAEDMEAGLEYVDDHGRHVASPRDPAKRERRPLSDEERVELDRLGAEIDAVMDAPLTGAEIVEQSLRGAEAEGDGKIAPVRRPFQGRPGGWRR